jgi:hypothetical protein
MQRGTTIGAAALGLLFGTLIAGCYVDGPRPAPYPYEGGYGSYPPYQPPPPSRPPSDGGWNDGRGDDRTSTLVCASKGGQSETCRTPFPIARAEVDKRYSDTRCDEGRNWGYNARQVWVTDGCRARFRLYPERSGGGWSGRPRGRLVRCESGGDKPRTCRVGDRIDRADLQRQLSDAPCEYGKTWGIQGDSIWVNRGCRGDFRVY